MPGSNYYSKNENPDAAVQAGASGGTPPANTGAEDSQFKGYGDIIRYEEEYLKNNPPESEKDRKKRERREKWEGIISGIGDAVSAVSNLYFASQYAPNMYDHRSSLSDKAKARWDKAKAERDAKRESYYQHAMRIANLKKADWDWRRQMDKDKHALEREGIEDKRYNDNIEYRNRRDAINDDRYQKAQERQRALDERQEKEAERRKINDDREYNLRREDIEERKIERKARAAKGVRGRKIGFTDNNGNQFAIYENVWRGSMQQVYDVLAEDMRQAYLNDKDNNPRVPLLRDAKRKDDFVKQYWHRSPRAKQIMLTLANLDPSTMTSEIGDEYDYDSDNGTMPGVQAGDGNKMPGVQ